VRFIGLDNHRPSLNDAQKLIHAKGALFDPRWPDVRTPNILPHVGEVRFQDFKEGLGLKPHEKPQIILMNNILYHLRDEQPCILFLDALDKLDSDGGILLSKNADVERIAHLFGIAYDDKFFHTVNKTTKKTSICMAFIKEGEEISCWELTHHGTLGIHLGTKSLEALKRVDKKMREAVEATFLNRKDNNLDEIPRSTFAAFPNGVILNYRLGYGRRSPIDYLAKKHL
jgi:hypothetical protein